MNKFQTPGPRDLGPPRKEILGSAPPPACAAVCSRPALKWPFWSLLLEALRLRSGYAVAANQAVHALP